MLALFISITGLIETVANATNNKSTETPGPNNSYLLQPNTSVIVIQEPVASIFMTQGPIIGSAIGGGLVVICLIGLVIRCKIIAAQLNTYKQTKTKSYKNLKYIDKFESVTMKNPLTHRFEHINKSRFEITPV
jgi:hypothetical protein